MIDREYVKLNTSIQTGSNATNLIHDEDGNVQAKIELRLPANLFDTNSGARKIQSVEMQTSKMRLSLENTPIAQIPVDKSLTTGSKIVSTCQLDVYPFSILNDKTWKPTNAEDSALPYYKKHEWKFIFRFTTNYQNADPPNGVFSNTFSLPPMSIHTASDTTGFPQNSLLYPFVEGVMQKRTLLNMCVPSNHEKPQVEDDQCQIKNVATLLQMFDDVLESAITYASVEENFERYVDFISNPAESVTGYDKDHPLKFEGYDDPFYLLSVTPTDVPDTNQNHLACAVKPIVRLNDQSLSIAYDTAGFVDKIPVVWNTAYVDTYDFPQQITFTEDANNEVWHKPPCKRQYQYSVNNDTSYSFGLADKPGSVTNIIANRATAETFSFLPWIKVDKTSLPQTDHWQKFLCTDTVTYDYSDVCTAVGYAFTRHDQNTRLQHNFVTGGWTEMAMTMDGTVVQRFAVAYYNIDDDGNKYNITVDYGSREIMTSEVMPVQGLSYVITNVDEMPDPIGWNNTSHSEIQIQQYSAFLPTDTPAVQNGVASTEVYTGGGDRTTVDGVIPYVQIKLENGTWVACMYHDADDRVWVGGYKLARSWPNVAPTSVVAYENQELGTSYRAMWQLPTTPQTESTHESNFTYVDGGQMICTYRDGPIGTPVRKTSTFTPIRTNVPSDEYCCNPSFEPNISGESFYILDGTGSQIQIDSAEPVEVDGAKNVEETTTVNTSRNTRIAEYDSGGLSPTLDSRTLTPSSVINGAYKIPKTVWHYDGLTVGHVNPSTGTWVGYEHTIYWRFRAPRTWATNPDWSVTSEHVIRIGLANPSSDESEVIETGSTTSGFQPISTNTTTNSFTTIDPKYEIGSSSTTSSSVLPPVQAAPQYGTLTIPPITDEVFRQARYFLKNTTTSWANAKELMDFISGSQIEDLDIPYLPFDPALDPYNQLHFDAEWHSPVEIDSPDDYFYFVWILDTEGTNVYNFQERSMRPILVTTTTDKVETTKEVEVTASDEPYYLGNVHLNFTWDNLPIVVMSPIASIVLTLDGMQVNQEFQPVNISQPQGASLTSTIPVIENFYSLAQTLRDLHDELVVAKESFDDTATYTIDSESGKQRTLKFSAKYITKDGRLHQIYIPPNGVFSLQLTFGITCYST